MQNETMIRPVPVYSPNGKMIGCVEGNLRAAVRKQVAAIRAYLEKEGEIDFRPAGGPVLGGSLEGVVPTFWDPSIRMVGLRPITRASDRSWKRHRRNRWRKTTIVSMVGA